MTHPSNTFIHSTNSLYFTDDSVVFFGFPSGNNTQNKAHQFTEACDAKNIAYRELCFPQSLYWHYEKCFEISVTSERELRAIEPIIALFGELNAIAEADETIVVFLTREELQEKYAMISNVYTANESD